MASKHCIIILSMILTLSKVNSSNADCKYLIHNNTTTKVSHEQCPKGEFYSFQVQGCKPCKICRPGSGMHCPCQVFLNTECKKCDLDHYSALMPMGRICLPCTHCKVYEMVIAHCNATHNTQCDKNSQSNQDSRTKNDNVKHDKNVYIYIMVALSIAVAIVIIVIIIICRKTRQQTTSAIKRDPETRFLDASSYSSVDDPRMRRFKNDSESIQSSLLSASGSERPDSRALHNPGVLLSRLPGTVSETLGKLLNPSLLYKDWQSLAGRLGYSALEIKNMHNNNRQDYTEHLLFSYNSRHPNTTIGDLYDVFVEMERTDAAEALRSYDAQTTRIDTPV